MRSISVVVCAQAVKQLVFYVSSPGSNSWVAAGAVLTYSAGGPILHCCGVSQLIGKCLPEQNNERILDT